MKVVGFDFKTPFVAFDDLVEVSIADQVLYKSLGDDLRVWLVEAE